VVAEALPVSLDKPLEWAIGLFFGNNGLGMELWATITGISGSMIEGCRCVAPNVEPGF